MNNLTVRSPALEIGQMFESLVGEMHTAMKVQRDGLLSGVSLSGLQNVALNDSAGGVATAGNGIQKSTVREV